MATPRKLAATLAALLVAGLVAVGCGGSDGSDGASGPEDDATTTVDEGTDADDGADDRDAPVSSDGGEDDGDAGGEGDAGAADGSSGEGSDPDEGTGTTVPGSATDPGADPDLPAPIAMVDAQTLTGLTLEEAELKADDFGWTLRIARLDGEDQALTEDYSPSRVNVEVADDTVIDIVSIG
jgi:hypothetical protein